LTYLHAQNTVDDMFSYDPATGVIERKLKPGRNPSGPVSRKPNGKGYLQVMHGGKNLLQHRLAWRLMTGTWPTKQIDHKNRDKTDNRWENLRLATNAEQQHNTDVKPNNTSGVIGVTWSPSKQRWLARIKVDGVSKHLGWYKTLDAAADARNRAEDRYGYVRLPREIR